MPRRLLEAGIAVAAMLVAAVAVRLVVMAGNVEEQRSIAAVRSLTGGGDPERGRQAILASGCGACHTIKGVTGADGKVGPDLSSISTQIYGGAGQHDPNLLIAWIGHPREIRPDTAMPDLSLSQNAARDIAAYLLHTN
jgi:cytochrome c2